MQNELKKPYENPKDVTFEMITTHPYFRNLSTLDLTDIIAYMDCTGFEKLPGADSWEKAQLLVSEFLKSDNKQTEPFQEIIGREVPCDIDAIGWKKGDLAEMWPKKIGNYYVKGKPEIMPAIVVEQWKPVLRKMEYKEEFELCGKKVSVIFTHDGIEINNLLPFKITEIKKVIDFWDEKFKSE